MPSQYKRFVAPTFPEARKMMFQEMGTNAYIVKSGPVKIRKWFGLKIETHYAIEAGLHLPHRADRDAAPRSAAPRAEPNPPPPSASAAEPARLPVGSEALLALLQERKQRPAAAAAIPAVPAETAPAVRPAAPVRGAAERPDEVVSFLAQREFSPELAAQVARVHALGHAPASDEERLDLARAVADCFTYLEGTRIYDTTPNALFLCGPTGVGKTTTLSKIAARLCMAEERRVVLASYDGVRLMAVQQLKKFAEILQLPFFVIEKPRDLVEGIRTHSHSQVILVDTAGAGGKEAGHLKDIAELIDGVQCPREVHLCLPAGMRRREMIRMLETFEAAQYDRVIITKTDESATLGAALSALHEKSLPISWVTTGQDVPRDLFAATPDRLARLLAQEWKTS